MSRNYQICPEAGFLNSDSLVFRLFWPNELSLRNVNLQSRIVCFATQIVLQYAQIRSKQFEKELVISSLFAKSKSLRSKANDLRFQSLRN